jgi:thymidylate synthase
MYKPLYKPNQVICGTGQVAIVTGWTVKQTIAKHFEPTEYAAIGNLYSSTRGISFLIRNLLYNPQVRYLAILSATKEDRNAGGCRCLYDFFRHGFTKGITDTGREAWVINSDIKGYIDIEIAEEALNKLRKTLKISYDILIEDLLLAVKYANQNPLISPHEQLTFPNAPEPESKILPGNLYGHRIEGKTIAETWVKILQRIRTTGVIRPTGYDGKWQELINLMAIVTDELTNCYFPEPNYLPLDREYLNNYYSQILDDAPKQEGVKYTYGQRLRSWFGEDQIEQVIQKLIKEIDAASAVMSLWDVKDHIKGGSPCLNHIWVRVNENVLSLTAVFRSNDMFNAWPANAMGLRILQEHIIQEISDRSEYKLKIGPLITLSQSAHVYDDTWENVDSIIDTYYKKLTQKVDYNDPVGNFVIENQHNTTVVNQVSLSGEIVASYKGKHPLKLLREITSANPSIRPDHTGYLGIELDRAVKCLGTPTHRPGYIQDSQQ